MTDPPRQRHPSGRPIRQQKQVTRPIWRVPDRGYVTPRLQDPPVSDRIGFVVSKLPGNQSDDEIELRGE